jgi:hypothetical protein
LPQPYSSSSLFPPHPHPYTAAGISFAAVFTVAAAVAIVWVVRARRNQKNGLQLQTVSLISPTDA